MTDNIRIAETFTLPSKGLIYDETINPEVTLSSMKTKHEMLRLSATDDSQKIMSTIIDDCIVDDIGISSYDLCLGDFQFLMYKLRVVTFGPEYEFGTICPYCGFENTVTVNLDEMEVKEFDDSLLDSLTFKLPKSGNEITLTLQTPRTIDKNQKLAREYKKRHKGSNENAIYLYTIVSSIAYIDGEVPDRIMLEEWVKDLPLVDTNALVNKIDEVNSKIGIDLSLDDTCALCKNNFNFPFRITPSFFRPNN